MIGQAELLPVLVAFKGWADRLRDRRVLVFIDKDAARFGLVACTARSDASLNLIIATAALVGELRAWPWYGRVPTRSNPADAPSRLEVESLHADGYRRLQPGWPESLLDPWGCRWS